MHGRVGRREISGRARHTLSLVNPFPPTSRALREPNGLLAVGGDLQPETLISAYAQGIFPWFNEGEDILWWSPDPRLVLRTAEVHISRSMRKTLKNSDWTLSYDDDFDAVIHHCAHVDRGGREAGTWITEAMQDAYLRLHQLGLAHSVEVREDGQLVGGLYGVLLGNMFFGESMFSLQANASKVAFIALSRTCHNSDIELIDCQVENPHLLSLGADLMSREDFENHVRDAIKVDMRSLLSKPLCMVPKPPLPLAMRLASDLPMSMGDLL